MEAFKGGEQISYKREECIIQTQCLILWCNRHPAALFPDDDWEEVRYRFSSFEKNEIVDERSVDDRFYK